MALDLEGLSSRPGDFLFRESPTLRSTGKTIVADTCPPCGRAFPIYRVSSFLDIFAEASADGGKIWASGDQAIQVVQQAEPVVLGDYSQNGTVDAADYVLWRKLVGTGALPNEGGVSNNLVDDADYKFWRCGLVPVRDRELSPLALQQSLSQRRGCFLLSGFWRRSLETAAGALISTRILVSAQ